MSVCINNEDRIINSTTLSVNDSALVRDTNQFSHASSWLSLCTCHQPSSLLPTTWSMSWLPMICKPWKRLTVEWRWLFRSQQWRKEGEGPQWNKTNTAHIKTTEFPQCQSWISTSLSPVCCNAERTSPSPLWVLLVRVPFCFPSIQLRQFEGIFHTLIHGRKKNGPSSTENKSYRTPSISYTNPEAAPIAETTL